VDAIGLLDQPATVIADAVRTGQVSAVEVLEVHLSRIAERDSALGAFTRLLPERARADAAAVDAHPDRASLALAGVPIAIKDNIAVEDIPTGNGSQALPGHHAPEDDVIVARLRAAGAIVVGVTRCPELCVFGSTDEPSGTARNPWDPTRVAGGSSGGSAAAVAGGLVPLAHASDGMGSVRIPAAANGLLGLKPGRGLIPVAGDLDGQHWFGMTQHGPIATTVGDVAVALDVMADVSRFGDAGEPSRVFRVAVSCSAPAPGLFVGTEQKAAVRRMADALAAAGHEIIDADPPYDTVAMIDLMVRWTAGTAADIEVLGADPARLQPRTRRHAAVGRVLAKLRPVQVAQADRWKSKVDTFLGEYDLLLTPAMLSAPPQGHGWYERGWLANVMQGLRWVPFASAWNLAELPAAAVPAGIDQLRMPLSVQVIAPRGCEDDLIAALRQIERVQPWQRHVG
jgi:amidase